MKEKIIKRINKWNDIKYGNDNKTRIIFTTLNVVG